MKTIYLHNIILILFLTMTYVQNDSQPVNSSFHIAPTVYVEMSNILSRGGQGEEYPG